MLNLLSCNIVPEASYDAVASCGGGVTLTARESERLRCSGTDGKKHTYILNGSFAFEDYIVLEYKAIGLRRQATLKKPFMYAVTADGDVPLFYYNDIFLDNCRHRLITAVPCFGCIDIKIEIHVDRRKRADFSIFRLYSCRTGELPLCCSSLLGGNEADFIPLDLSDFYNKSCVMHDCMIDGGAFFNNERISLSGIPFSVKASGSNMIAPPPPPPENNDIISNFGVSAKRRLCRPISRDSLTKIPVNMCASEFYFILGLSGNRHQRWGFASDGPIVGTYCGDVTMPAFINDVESFCVEIVYSSGRHDIAVPMNIATHRHGVSGDLGLYAVPASYEQAEALIFHNRMLDTDVSIAAITVNQTEERLFPEMLIPEKRFSTHMVSCGEKQITCSGSVIKIRNGAISMDIDISSGMKLVGFSNSYTPQMKFKSGSLLRLENGGKNMAVDFVPDSLQLNEDFAMFCFRCENILLKISASIKKDNAIVWELSAKNTGASAVNTSILFPCISGLEYSSDDDSRYFFPKYQNIDSNETVFIYEESAPSFPMQFFDVYSKRQNGGIAVTTEERGLTVRKYALEKDSGGISFFIEYPQMYVKLAPDGSFSASATVLTAHSGDWHESFRLYKSWLDSWYEPYRCQDKDWYRKSFWLLAEITDFYETEEFTRLPVWYDKDKKEFNFLKILNEQKEITGVYPDILHLWSWAYRKENGVYCQQWGNFGSTDYDEYGGAEIFRDALHNVTDKTGVAVSLYLHPTLLSARYPQSEEFFPKHRVVTENGKFISIEGDSYRMCHANKEWREYAISMYPRIYRELGIPLLYVDEFSLRIDNRCHSAAHGHEVPSNLLKTDRDFIIGLKEAMPEEVVLYGEYAAVDVNARYIDCNITYYILDSIADMVETAWRADDGDDRLGRVMTNIYRFAFPKIVQLVLPMAMRNMSWHPLKFIFFNGEAVYDSFWDCEESRGLEFMVKAYKIKKKYADCFSSDNPETMIDTLTPAVCANRFPGQNRTIYTLYNRAYITYRGEILSIPHTDGAVYYDVWNDKPIEAKISDGFALIPYELHAQHIGCIEVRE